MKPSIVRLPVESPSPSLQYAVVSDVTEHGITVESGYSNYNAQLAASCLVSPLPGDRVLVVNGGGEEAFILAVLDREANRHEPTGLNLEGDVCLNVRNGSLEIRAEKGMHLAAREELSAVASTLDLRATSASLLAETARLEGAHLETKFREVRMLAEKCREILGIFTQQCNSSTRMVEEHDELQAGSIRQAADGTMTTQARNIFQAAEENVHIDAEKIHLG